jgi:hypothetical protein
MTKTFSNLPENVIEFPRKLKWADEVLKESKEKKSPPSQYLLDWWATHPEQDPRNQK